MGYKLHTRGPLSLLKCQNSEVTVSGLEGLVHKLVPVAIEQDRETHVDKDKIIFAAERVQQNIT